MVTAKPVTASKNGKDPLTDEGLQALTVEGFSTATVLSTEHDLQTYFNNYKYRYNNEVLFIKKRDDAVERLCMISLCDLQRRHFTESMKQ